MDDDTAPSLPRPPVQILEPVDEALAASLAAQGDPGARALGLLRDAHRMLCDDRYERSAEIAESCLRGAAESLLSLGGTKPGLAAAARALLKAVDAYQPPAEPAGTEPPSAAGAGRRRRKDPTAVLQEVRSAAEALRAELSTPGGYHRRRIADVVEQNTGHRPGPAQEMLALTVWGDLYSTTSTTLHGKASGLDAAAERYRTLLAAAREVFVPLPGRAAQVLALSRVQHPTEANAKTLASWADPRATEYFFLSLPAVGWLDLLDEALLMPDPGAEGAWLAWPYLDYLSDDHASTVRRWLADRASAITEAGPKARAGLLRLAARPGIGLTNQVHALVAGSLRPGTAPDGAVLRVAASWACGLPLADRDEHWLRTVEALLRAAVDAVHDDADATNAITLAVLEGRLTDDDAQEQYATLLVDRLPDHEAAALMAQLAPTVRHLRTADGQLGAAALAVTIRIVAAVLLVRDLGRIHAGLRPVVFGEDLAQVRLADPGLQLGPRLARTVLEVAAADAAAGRPFAERTAELTGRLATTDAPLADRLLAAHLADTAPDSEPTSEDGTTAAGRDGEWWDQSLALAGRLPANAPAPETSSLLELVLAACPIARAHGLRTDLAAALGAAPTEADLTAHQNTGAPWPATWLRAWDWSPVLPPEVLADWAPVLAALRTVEPAGPRDPRLPRKPLAWIERTPHTVSAEELADLAAEQDPTAAAARLAAAPDASHPRYVLVLQQLIHADPAAWTTNPAVIVNALAQPSLQAFYLAVAALQVDRPTAFPDTALADATGAALDLHRALTAPDLAHTTGPSDGQADDATAAVLHFASQAMFDLLTAAWRADTDLGATLPNALAHLHALTEPLTHPAQPSAPGQPDESPESDQAVQDPGPIATQPPVRALQCLLEHAAYDARTTSLVSLPDGLLERLDAVLTARPDDSSTAQALALRLPLLHSLARDLTVRHRDHLLALPIDGRPTAASLWLRWGTTDALLLIDLDRAELLAYLRAAAPRPATRQLALVLLACPDALDSPATLFTDLAAGPGGPEALSHLLQQIAHLAAAATSATVHTAAQTLWRAALAATTPPGALAGAGAFATTTVVPDDTWLTLTLGTTRRTPILTDPDHIAERCAHHPNHRGALRLMAHLLAHPGTPWQDHTVRLQARRLLAAAEALPPGNGQGNLVDALRAALINAGDLDAS
ncbi:hypothetical protein [Kitasatospora sp. NPDC059827]|uniref:hypothetical protein n=1 Tax=Kitasatospora sp. NPDC059827 TaxID=3346964 RepID=UPI0036493C4B